MKKLLTAMVVMGLSFAAFTMSGGQMANAATVEEIYTQDIVDDTCEHDWVIDEDGYYNETYDNGDEMISYKCTLCESTKVVLKHKNVQSYVTKASYGTNGYQEGSTGKICKDCYFGYDQVSKTWAPAVSMTISKTKYYYKGSQIKPKVTVKDYNGKTVSSKYYTVTYKNNILPGNATVKVTMKDRYKGSFKTTFMILPGKATIKSVKYTGNASMSVKWKKLKGVSGYAIQYSTSKKFAEGNTCTLLVSSKSTSKVIKTLAQTTYYVRVTGYKTINKAKYPGRYSSKLSVTIKTGSSVKQMLNAIKSTTKYYKYIKNWTDNKVDIRKYKTTYDRIRAIYTWHAKNSAGFGNCLECNYNFACCVNYLTYGSKSYDRWIRIACDRYKNNSGSVVQHKWCVLMLQGTKYIFDPRMQGNLGQSSGFSHFGTTYGSSAGKHYLFDAWWI